MIRVKYQGEDIGFSVKAYTDELKTTLFNLDTTKDIIIYVYTDGCKKVMFSKQVREGYNPLYRMSENEYSGIIDSKDTKLMAVGKLTMEVNIVEYEPSMSDDKWNIIQKGTICQLHKSLIKIES